LYLDLVVYPDGTIIEDDMDELEEALRENVINLQQYELAIETSNRLKNTLLFNIESFKDYTYSCYDLLLMNKLKPDVDLVTNIDSSYIKW